jgi:formylglycine-generating enzyme required for sulfatase activity
VYRDGKRRERERSLAMEILADYAFDRPSELADFLLDADEEQFDVLYVYTKFEEQQDRGLSALEAELDKKLPADAKNDAKEKLAKRQAIAAVALLRMNRPEKVWPLLKHSPDPRVRSYLIHRLGPLGVDASAILKRLDEEPDLSIHRAVILSLGEYGAEAWPSGARDLLIKMMRELYRTADDPGLHAAAEWLLRQPQWQQQEWLRQTNEAWAKDKATQEKRLEDIKQGLAKERGKAKAQWYVNGQGQTMVVIPGPVEFEMGPPPAEEGRLAMEFRHRQRIGRTFAIAATPVTKEQFLRFLPEFGHPEMGRYPDPTCPIGGVVWYEAAEYCNWLSKQEGMAEREWCYVPNQEGKYAEGMKLKENHLSLSGYRLPTDAEWEYACRAEAVTSRYYGESEELLRHYGWYSQNSAGRTWPVGSKKPNDLGLFDMYGNVWNWCQEKHRNYPAGERCDDSEDSLNINAGDHRVIRGGSSNVQGVYVRSAHRGRWLPRDLSDHIGFRLARTITPEKNH